MGFEYGELAKAIIDELRADRLVALEGEPAALAAELGAWMTDRVSLPMGSELAEWLIDHAAVDDVFADDEQLHELVRDHAERHRVIAGAPTEPVDAETLLRRYGATAFQPVFAGDDDPARSKVGGTPWLTGPWPTCPVCQHAMRFVLQLARDDVPESFAWAFNEDLVQLFLCDWQGRIDAPELPRWLCQADGHGWQPFAPTTLVRHVTRTDRVDIGTALSHQARERLVVAQHRSLAAYCRETGTAEPPAPTTAALEKAIAVLATVPASEMEYLVHGHFLYPAETVERWSSVTDVPGYQDDIDEDERERIRDELGVECRWGLKLGGFPCWFQDPATPECRTCRAPMQMLFQIPSRSTITIGGDGTGWLFSCPTCRDATFLWQR